MPALEYKKNQLKAHKLIKEAIEEAIRKMLPLQLILKKYLGIMSEINDDKYLKPLVNTESNNNQYQLTKSEKNLSSDSEKNDQKGGVIQSQPPMSLKEIYEQQKKAGLNSSSIKHIPLSGAATASESKRSESAKKINILIPPDPSKLMPHFKTKNNDSDSSQPYHKQNGCI
jgi:hypothetical protein